MKTVVKYDYIFGPMTSCKRWSIAVLHFTFITSKKKYSFTNFLFLVSKRPVICHTHLLSFLALSRYIFLIFWYWIISLLKPHKADWMQGLPHSPLCLSCSWERTIRITHFSFYTYNAIVLFYKLIYIIFTSTFPVGVSRLVTLTVQ